MELSTVAECVFIDDIIQYLVDLYALPYGVSAAINKLIDKRDIRNGLDEAVARCIRMIELVNTNFSDIVDLIDTEDYIDVTLNFGTEKITSDMNEKYGLSGHQFYYLAYRISLIEWKKTYGGFTDNVIETIRHIIKLDSDGNIEFNGCYTPENIETNQLKMLFMIKVSNMFSAMIGSNERYSEDFNVTTSWICKYCSTDIDYCSRDHEKLSYRYKYSYSMKLIKDTKYKNWFEVA